jgi:hypothetical protein
MIQRAILLTGLLMVATEARADEDPAVREAKQLMKEGKDLFAKTQFQKARERYAKACDLVHSASCISGLAITELRAGKLVDAYRHFQEVLRDRQSLASVPAATADALPKMAAEAYGQIGHVDVDAPTGAQVRLDGAIVGVAPLDDCLHLEPGDHTIDAEGSLEHAQVTVHAVAGEVVHARFAFALHEIGAGVVLAPPRTIAPPVVDIGAAGLETAPQASAPTPFWRPKYTWSAILGGVGVVALGLGTGFGLAGQNAADRAAKLRASILAMSAGGSVCGVAPSTAGCSDLSNAYSEQSRDRALSLAFFAAGGVAVLAGAAVFLWPVAKTAEHAAVIPMIDRRGGGFELVRRF